MVRAACRAGMLTYIAELDARRSGCERSAGTHDLNGTRGVSRDGVGDGAEEKTSDRAVAVGAHDDEVAAPSLGFFDNELFGRAFEDICGYGEIGRAACYFRGGFCNGAGGALMFVFD